MAAAKGAVPERLCRWTRLFYPLDKRKITKIKSKIRSKIAVPMKKKGRDCQLGAKTSGLFPGFGVKLPRALTMEGFAVNAGINID